MLFYETSARSTFVVLKLLKFLKLIIKRFKKEKWKKKMVKKYIYKIKEKRTHIFIYIRIYYTIKIML